MYESILLIPPPTQVAIFVDLFIFFSYVIMSSFLLYIGKLIHYKKKISLPWIVLALGLLFSSLNFIVGLGGTYVLARPVIWYLFSLIGSVCLLEGFVLVFLERVFGVSMLRARELEIREVIDYLKKRYYEKEISEEDLKRLHAELLHQLAEVNVKLKKHKKIGITLSNFFILSRYRFSWSKNFLLLFWSL